MLGEVWKAFTVALGVNETKTAELALLFCFFLPQHKTMMKNTVLFMKIKMLVVVFFFFTPVVRGAQVPEGMLM